jgi:thiol:disulfide interchange protein
MRPVEQKYKNKVAFVDIDVANRTPETQALMRKYNVRVVPTLVFINKQGQVVKVTEGSMPKQQLEGYLDSISND